MKNGTKLQRRDYIKFLRRNPHKREKEISILDLFFDIILVVFIGGVSHFLIHEFAHDTSNWRGITLSVLELASVLIVWRLYVMRSARILQDVIFRLNTLFLMGALLTMGVASYFGLDSDSSFIMNVVGWMCAMVSLIISIITFPNKLPELKMYRVRTYLSFIFSIILSAIALSVYMSINDSQLKMNIGISLWVINIFQLIGLQEFGNKFIASKHLRDVFEERFNILFILFVAEGLTIIVSTYAETHQGRIWSGDLSYIVLGFLLMFGWWWMFNDQISYTSLKNDRTSVTTFTYVMLIWDICVTLMFVSIALAIDGNDEIATLLFTYAHSIGFVAFCILIFAQEPFHEEHKYIRPKALDKFMVISIPITIAIELTIAYLYPDPMIILGADDAAVFIWNLTMSLMWIRISAHYRMHPELFEEHKVKLR